jgi:hypothetical protein
MSHAMQSGLQQWPGGGFPNVAKNSPSMVRDNAHSGIRGESLGFGPGWLLSPSAIESADIHDRECDLGRFARSSRREASILVRMWLGDNMEPRVGQ